MPGEPLTTDCAEWRLLVQTLGETQRSVDDVKAMVVDVRQFITGNGHMEGGLLYRVKMLEVDAQEQADGRQEHKDDFKKIVFPLVTDILKVAAGGGIAAWLLSWLKQGI